MSPIILFCLVHFFLIFFSHSYALSLIYQMVAFNCHMNMSCRIIGQKWANYALQIRESFSWIKDFLLWVFLEVQVFESFFLDDEVLLDIIWQFSSCNNALFPWHITSLHCNSFSWPCLTTLSIEVIHTIFCFLIFF